MRSVVKLPPPTDLAAWHKPATSKCASSCIEHVARTLAIRPSNIPQGLHDKLQATFTSLELQWAKIYVPMDEWAVKAVREGRPLAPSDFARAVKPLRDLVYFTTHVLNEQQVSEAVQLANRLGLSLQVKDFHCCGFEHGRPNRRFRYVPHHARKTIADSTTSRLPSRSAWPDKMSHVPASRARDDETSRAGKTMRLDDILSTFPPPPEA